MLSTLATNRGVAVAATITVVAGESGAFVSLEGGLVGGHIMTAIDALMKAEAELLAMIL